MKKEVFCLSAISSAIAIATLSASPSFAQGLVPDFDTGSTFGGTGGAVTITIPLDANFTPQLGSTTIGGQVAFPDDFPIPGGPFTLSFPLLDLGSGSGSGSTFGISSGLLSSAQGVPEPSPILGTLTFVVLSGAGLIWKRCLKKQVAS